MESLLQSGRRRDDGEALPTVFKSLADKGVHFYRGSVHVTAAAPGVGKSIFALRHALGMPSVPTLYICMDTPRHITVVRAAQMLTTSYKAVVEAQLEEAESEIWDELATANHIGAFYRSGVTAEEITLMIGAFAEIKGEFPHYVIIDNLVNIAYEGDSEVQAQRTIMSELDTIAKEANICVHILTHVSGNYKGGTTPIPQDGVMNKISEYQHTTITLTRSLTENQLLWACVKNRTGPSDPSGMNRTPLKANFDVMQIEDSIRAEIEYVDSVPNQFPAKYEGRCSSDDCDFFENAISIDDPIVLYEGRPYHVECA